jgi:hypothetical protein
MATIKLETENYGEVEVRNAMLEDDNGTNLHDGIEIKVDGEDLIEIYGYYDVEELTKEELEELIENKL